MKKIILVFSSLFIYSFLFAQNREMRDCGTPTPSAPLFVDDAMQERVLQYTSPLLMKVFVHVIANDDGSNRAVQDTSMFRQLENMRQFFAPHGICFILAGIEQINSTDLNFHDVSEELELTFFLIPDVLNIFIHAELTDGSVNLNGSAYSIPNYYISLVRGAIESSTNRSTTAHEIGHCFGLYHPFERVFGVENIPRSGGCMNCSTTGDLLCDTEADPHSDNYDTGDFINENCIYSGTAAQLCNANLLFYNMDPRNVMAYGRRDCRNMFSPGQGLRSRSIIVTNPILQPCIAPDSDNITSNQTISSGRRLFIARNNLTVNTASFIVQNSAMVNLSSSNSIIIHPGAEFKPSTGYVHIIVSILCQ